MQGNGGSSHRGHTGSSPSGSAAAAERQEWGELMPLSTIGGNDGADAHPTPPHLSRAASEDWELLGVHSPSSSRAESVASHSSGIQGVEVRIVPEDGAVTLCVTPVASPLHSPRPSVRMLTAMQAGNAPVESAATPAVATVGGSGGSLAHSFEHLSDHFAPPSEAGSDGEDMMAPPSLPDLEALPDISSNYGGSPSSMSASETGMQASFAEQLQLAAAALASPGSASMAASVTEAASPLGSSYSDLASSASCGSIACGRETSSTLQQAIQQLQEQDEIAPAGDIQEADQDPEAGDGNDAETGGPVSFYASLKSFLVGGIPSADFACLWHRIQFKLQGWGEAMTLRLPALPLQIARPAAYAGKRVRGVSLQSLALGASISTVAVLSFLLYNSYSANRRLRAALGRKETDLLHLISRVVSMQRDMLRPRNVPIIRHTGSVCTFPAMDIF